MAEKIQLGILILIGTIISIFLISIIVMSLLIYQRSQNKHFQEVLKLKSEYQQEILKAELEMKEHTFNSISQEIHDNIGQVLSLAKLNINTLNLSDSNGLAEKLMSTKDLISKAINDLRNLSKTLNTEYIIQQSLSKSLSFELDIIERTGIYKTNFVLNGEEKSIDPQKQLIVFRITQESINNIIKHANAKTINLNLSYHEKLVTLQIVDDGIGFQTSAIHEKKTYDKGTGLINMLHRARLIGGELIITSNLEIGTTLMLTLPI